MRAYGEILLSPACKTKLHFHMELTCVFVSTCNTHLKMCQSSLYTEMVLKAQEALAIGRFCRT